MGADNRMDLFLVGAIARQYLVLFGLPYAYPEIALRLGGRFASPNLTPNVSSLAQCERALHSPGQPMESSVPTSYLEQLWITPRGASPTISFSTRLTWSTKPFVARRSL